MRQVLFNVLIGRPWSLWATEPELEVPGIGLGVLWLILGGAWVLFRWFRAEQRSAAAIITPVAYWIGGLILAALLPSFIAVQAVPVFGYGVMVLIGFTIGVWLATRRAVQEGIDRELCIDCAFWLLVCGIFGARLFYLLQYGDRVFRDADSLGEYLLAAVNLRNGGIVLYGALLGGAAAYFTFCRVKNVNALRLADIATPSIFVGIGFGRIGCLLNGCCFGDRCDLPWGLKFPSGTVPFDTLVQRGFVDPEALATMPLHPTQIYSSLNAFLLAFLTASLFPYRRHNGEVFGVGLMLYPLTRFLLELLRGDEMGQFGTGLTISQLVSLGLFAAGAIFLIAGRFGLRGDDRQATKSGQPRSAARTSS